MSEPLHFTPLKTSKPMPRWVWLVVALIFVVLGGLIWFLRSNAAQGTVEADKSAKAGVDKASLTVRVASASAGSATKVLGANGNISPWQEASVGAQVSGLKLISVNANVGDTVRKGQVLATFANETGQADYLQAQAQYDNAKGDADRARSIQDTGALSKQQLSQYFTQEKVAAAQLKAAKVRLDHATLTSPDNGVISARSATVGAVVGAGQELFRLIRGGRLEWRAEVTPQEVGLVKVGQYASIESAAGTQLRGTVRAIAPSADAQTRNILVYVDVPKHPELKAGMFAKGSFELGQSEGLFMPAQAVVARDGFHYVFTLNANKSVTQKRVKLGRHIGEQVELLEGVSAADQIVVDGAGFLNDGDIVRVGS